MKAINQTRQKVLAENVVIADTTCRRMKGLLGRRSLLPTEALLIKPCNQVHTFFMRFPIDILFVNKENRVIKAVSSLKPFRITPLYFSASFALELPAGSIQSSSTQVEDILSFI